jgi:hypothetical protein
VTINVIQDVIDYDNRSLAVEKKRKENFTALTILQSTFLSKINFNFSKRNYFLPIIIYLNKYNLPGIAFIPQSMTTAPGLTQLPLTNSGFPTATTRISALRHYKYVNVLQLKYFTTR